MPKIALPARKTRSDDDHFARAMDDIKFVHQEDRHVLNLEDVI